MSSKSKRRADNKPLVDQLISSRIELRNAWIQEKKEQLAELRRKIETRGEEDNGVQILFPEEVWLLVFELLGPEDQRSCSNTCQLFRQYLKPARDLVLLRQVLNILIHRKDLVVKDLLNLRLVSKSFNHWTTHLLQSPQTWDSFPIFGIIDWTCPLITHRIPHMAKKRTAILNHPSNPFLGRWLRPLFTTAHDLRCDNSDVDEARVVEVQQGKQLVMETLGHNIWYLAFAVIGSAEGVDENDILLCLRTCPNLRRLEIGLVNNIWPSDNPELIFSRELQNLQVPNLTRLIMSNKWFGKANEYFLTVQNQLVEKFAGQLTELQITTWNVNYSQVSWPNLKILRFEECKTSGVLESLKVLNAPKLESLWFALKEEAKDKLELFLEALEKFPNLQELRLVFDWQWNIEENEVKNLLKQTKFGTFPNLKRLCIKTGFCDGITYSFVALFPYLESLHVCYGGDHLDLEETLQNLGLVEIKNEKLKPRMYKITKKQRQSEMIRLREYLYKNEEMMRHESLVWRLLPGLKLVEVVSKTGGQTIPRLKFLDEEVIY